MAVLSPPARSRGDNAPPVVTSVEKLSPRETEALPDAVAAMRAVFAHGSAEEIAESTGHDRTSVYRWISQRDYRAPRLPSLLTLPDAEQEALLIWWRGRLDARRRGSPIPVDVRVPKTVVRVAELSVRLRTARSAEDRQQLALDFNEAGRELAGIGQQLEIEIAARHEDGEEPES